MAKHYNCWGIHLDHNSPLNLSYVLNIELAKLHSGNTCNSVRFIVIMALFRLLFKLPASSVWQILVLVNLGLLSQIRCSLERQHLLPVVLIKLTRILYRAQKLNGHKSKFFEPVNKVKKNQVILEVDGVYWKGKVFDWFK